MSDLKDSLPDKSSDVQYDEYAKQLTEHRWVLAQIVRHVLPELKGRSVDQVLEMIEPDIHARVPLAPGRTNAPDPADSTGRMMGLNTEDKASHEGAVVFDFLFGMQLPDQEDSTTVGVMVDVELMRQLSSKYTLGDRKQVYIGRSLGTEVGRNITHQKYSDAYPAISIWLCFNQEVNTLLYATIDEKLLAGRRNTKLEVDRPLMHVYTVGFRNDGPQGDEEEHEELFELLAALYSATMPKEEKLRILNDQFGLRDAAESEQDKIEEEVSNMSTIQAVMRRDFNRMLEGKNKEIKDLKQQVQDKTDRIQHQADEIQHQADEIQHQADEIQHLADEIQKLRAVLAGREKD